MNRKLRQAALGVATVIASLGYVGTCVSQATAHPTTEATPLSYELECDAPASFEVAAARAGSGVLAPARAVRVPLAVRRAEGFKRECNYSSWCDRNSPHACVNKDGYCSQCCYGRRPATPLRLLR